MRNQDRICKTMQTIQQQRNNVVQRRPNIVGVAQTMAEAADTSDIRHDKAQNLNR